jgi:hypothetical protein
MIWLSMRGLIWIEVIAWTVPTASTTTGIALRSAVATTTGTAPPGLRRPRRPCGWAWAAGLPWACSAALADVPMPNWRAISPR